MKNTSYLLIALFGLSSLLTQAEVLYKSDFDKNPTGNKLIENGVLAIKNLKAWNSLKIFDDECEGDFRITLKYRFPGELTKGFMGVDLCGEEGTFKLIAHPEMIHYNYNFVDKAKKGQAEAVFGKKIEAPEKTDAWQTIVLTYQNGAFTAEYNGVTLGSVKFTPGILEKVVLSGAYIDVEFQEVLLETLTAEK